MDTEAKIKISIVGGGYQDLYVSAQGDNQKPSELAHDFSSSF